MEYHARDLPRKRSKAEPETLTRKDYGLHREALEGKRCVHLLLSPHIFVIEASLTLVQHKALGIKLLDGNP